MSSTARARWSVCLLILAPALIAAAALARGEYEYRGAMLAERAIEARTEFWGYWLHDVPRFAWESQRAAIDGLHPAQAMRRWGAAGLALLWMSGAAAAGRFLLSKFVPDGAGTGERSAARGLGFTAAGLVTLAIGLAGIAMRPALMAICGAGVALGIAEALRALHRWRASGSAPLESLKSVCHNYSYVGFSLVGIAFVYALAPATQSDGIRYHLGALSEWMKAGRIEFLPHQSFASFPFLVEMHYFAGMGLLRDPIAAGVFAKVCHWTLFVWSLTAIGDLARRLARADNGRDADRDIAARWARAIYAATPAAAILAGWSFIDHGIVFLLIASLLALLRCAGDSMDSKPSRHPILVGVLAGGLVGTKYTMLLPVGMFALGTAFFTLGSAQSKLRAVVLCSLAAAAVGGPWFLKNAVQTGGNPIYPASIGGRLPAPGWPAEADALLKSSMSLKGNRLDPQTGLPTQTELWRLPWEATVRWENYEAQFLGLLPIFALLAPLVFLALGGGKRPDEGRAFAFLLGAALFAAWALTYRSNRMLLPVAALTAAALGALMATVAEDIVAKRLVGAALWLHVVLGTAFFAHWLLVGQRPAPLPVALGMQDDRVYLSQALGHYDAARQLNDLAALTGEGALLIGEHRPYYFEGRILFADWFNPPVLRSLCDEYPTNAALFEGLKARGIGYIFFNRAELQLYRYVPLYFAERLGPSGYDRFLQLEAELKLAPRLAGSESVAIYKLPR